MRFTLNLATRTYINSPQVNLIMWSVGIVLIVGLAGLSFRAIQNSGEQQKLQTALAELEARVKASAKGVSAKEYQALLGRIKAANDIIRRKSFNWVGFLDRLELVLPDGVMVTSLEPSPNDGTLKISGVAGNFRSMRGFLENLEDSRFFTDVYLLSQTEAKVDETQKGISFSVSCKADLTKL